MIRVCCDSGAQLDLAVAARHGIEVVPLTVTIDGVAHPASFGYPAWSLCGDLTMIGRMLRGGNDELTRIATAWLAENPEDCAAGPALARAREAQRS